MKLLRPSVVLSVVMAGSATTWAQSPQPPAPSHNSVQAVPSPAPQVAKPANIDRNGVLMLIRSTLIAVDHADKTGNYTVLRDLGAPGFQVSNSAARLTEIFAKLRNDKVDLSGVAVLDPQLTLLPQIEANGMMHMTGFFPSVPTQVNFELLFAPIDGQWRLYGVAVNVGSSAPVAPQPAATLPIQTPTAQPKTPAPKNIPAAK